ncbi:hypothetical protein G7Z17_g2069 [Cylindrodendrum hubeiense]|uniref:Uncharacterized protein n=1 Tax=Cylindrodendrum hubeiense TaxID=595255 RepID=A0A9P5LKQ0_9HYPO|nr:hypothetical protein G7Z17_g2069 [Cylindrodendrum hubeiense]
MKFLTKEVFLPWLAFIHGSVAGAPSFSVTEDPGEESLYAASFGAAGIPGSVESLIGGGDRTGTFTNGPLDIPDGVILTTGKATGALYERSERPTTRSVSTYCTGGYDASIFKVNFNFPDDVETIVVKYIFATSEDRSLITSDQIITWATYDGASDTDTDINTYPHADNHTQQHADVDADVDKYYNKSAYADPDAHFDGHYKSVHDDIRRRHYTIYPKEQHDWDYNR